MGACRDLRVPRDHGRARHARADRTDGVRIRARRQHRGAGRRPRGRRCILSGRSDRQRPRRPRPIRPLPPRRCRQCKRGGGEGARFTRLRRLRGGDCAKARRGSVADRRGAADQPHRIHARLPGARCQDRRRAGARRQRPAPGRGLFVETGRRAAGQRPADRASRSNSLRRSLRTSAAPSSTASGRWRARTLRPHSRTAWSP